jgi:hypothetical protein
MKRLIPVALLVLAFTCGLHAQVVDTTVCDVLKNPKSFDGKMVRIKGTVSVDFDQFVVTDTDCGYLINGIWISYPAGTKGKAGPVALLQVQAAHNFTGTLEPVTRTPVTLDKSKDFKQFDSLLSQTRNRYGLCLACFKNKVSATLVGRLDGVANPALKRDPSGKVVGFGGFGNMNAYPARLVLQSVSDVSAKEIDYSASDAASKTDVPAGPQSPSLDTSDPLDVARKAVAGFTTGEAGTQIQKALAAYPKLKEQNGVLVGYGTINEVPANEGQLGAQNSPDGVLFICTFNRDRLQGDQLSIVIIHMGMHIVQLRNQPAGNEQAPQFVNEYNAWAFTLVAVVASGHKTITFPGGNLMWNAAWPEADRSNQFNNALKTFLTNEEMISR